jgi:hypothetical protein
MRPCSSHPRRTSHLFLLGDNLSLASRWRSSPKNPSLFRRPVATDCCISTWRLSTARPSWHAWKDRQNDENLHSGKISNCVCHGGHNFPPLSSNLCSDAISTCTTNRLPPCRLCSRHRPTAAEVGLLLGAEPSSLGPNRRCVLGCDGRCSQPTAGGLAEPHLHALLHRLPLHLPPNRCGCRSSPRHQPSSPPTARSALVAPHREMMTIGW